MKLKLKRPNGFDDRIVEEKQPDVLDPFIPTISLIDPGIGRFIYRLACRAAGKGERGLQQHEF